MQKGEDCGWGTEVNADVPMQVCHGMIPAPFSILGTAGAYSVPPPSLRRALEALYQPPDIDIDIDIAASSIFLLIIAPYTHTLAIVILVFISLRACLAFSNIALA